MEEDRISKLSDDILLLILDKINTFEAVKTTILSHRWKNLWCLLRSFRFHLNFATLGTFSPVRCQLVSQLLSHRDAAAAVHDFHLSCRNTCPYEVDREFVEACVPINHCVQSLRLHWPTKHTLRLPAAFLTCQTLRELELRRLCSSAKLPGRLSLPNLKTFHLETLLFFDDDDISMEPFSGLPELEKLTLVNYPVDGLAIRAPNLRVLEITDISQVEEISAPLVTTFIYHGNKAWKCEKVNLPMLEQVYVHIYDNRYCVNHNDFYRMSGQFVNVTKCKFDVGTPKVPFSANCEDGSINF